MVALETEHWNKKKRKESYWRKPTKKEPIQLTQPKFHVVPIVLFFNAESLKLNDRKKNTQQYTRTYTTHMCTTQRNEIKKKENINKRLQAIEIENNDEFYPYNVSIKSESLVFLRRRREKNASLLCLVTIVYFDDYHP